MIDKFTSSLPFLASSQSINDASGDIKVNSESAIISRFRRRRGKNWTDYGHVKSDGSKRSTVDHGRHHLKDLPVDSHLDHHHHHYDQYKRCSKMASLSANSYTNYLKQYRGHILHYKLLSLFLLNLLNLMCLIDAQSTAVIQQRFDIEPTDKSAIIGETILLPCRVLNKVGTLQWARDGFGLGSDRPLVSYPRYQMVGSDEEGDFSLQISGVTLEDDAVFQCQVGAAAGTSHIKSRNSVLTVFVPPEAPKILQGDHLKATAGSTVELVCESNGGKPAAELTWLDGEANPIRTGIEYSKPVLADGKRANAVLKWTFIPKREHHGKVFTCRSENPALKQPQKASIRLEVRYPPEIQLTTQKELYKEGEDVKFTCKALANPSDNLIYKWYKNDEPIVPSPNTNYVVSQVSRAMNGVKITCEVTNLIGTSKATAHVNVAFGPTLSMEADSIRTVSEGESVKLYCDIDGNPKPKIFWFFNDSKDIIEIGRSHTIPAMSESKVGRYTCRGSVDDSLHVSASIHVFIKGPPKIISPPIQYATEDKPIQVECLVRSVPVESKVTWTHNSQTIDIVNDKDIAVIQANEPKESLVRNILLIHNPHEDKFGDYNCSVSNEHGQDFKIITLAKSRTFPTFSTVGAIIGAFVLVITLPIIVILCVKRKSANSSDNYIGDVKKESVNKNSSQLTINSKNGPMDQVQHSQSVIDTGSSGADSDLKMEIRTASSLSERGQWDDMNEPPPPPSDSTTVNQIQHVVDNIYNYTSHALYSPGKDLSNNNGYISAYGEYTRECLPPNSMSGHSLVAQVPQSPNIIGIGQSHAHQQVPLQQVTPIMASQYGPHRDQYISSSSPYGTLPMEPHYRTPPYNPYVRNAATLNGTLSYPNQGSQSSNNSIYSTNPRYITATAASNPIKQGTMATHV